MIAFRNGLYSLDSQSLFTVPNEFTNLAFLHGDSSGTFANPEHPKIVKLNSFFQKLIPDDDDRLEFQKNLSRMVFLSPDKNLLLFQNSGSARGSTVGGTRQTSPMGGSSLPIPAREYAGILQTFSNLLHNTFSRVFSNTLNCQILESVQFDDGVQGKLLLIHDRSESTDSDEESDQVKTFQCGDGDCGEIDLINLNDCKQAFLYQMITWLYLPSSKEAEKDHNSLNCVLQTAALFLLLFVFLLNILVLAALLI